MAEVHSSSGSDAGDSDKMENASQRSYDLSTSQFGETDKPVMPVTDIDAFEFDTPVTDIDDIILQKHKRIEIIEKRDKDYNENDKKEIDSGPPPSPIKVNVQPTEQKESAKNHVVVANGTTPTEDPEEGNLAHLTVISLKPKYVSENDEKKLSNGHSAPVKEGESEKGEAPSEGQEGREDDVDIIQKDVPAGTLSSNATGTAKRVTFAPGTADRRPGKMFMNGHPYAYENPNYETLKAPGWYPSDPSPYIHFAPARTYPPTRPFHERSIAEEVIRKHDEKCSVCMRVGIAVMIILLLAVAGAMAYIFLKGKLIPVFT